MSSFVDTTLQPFLRFSLIANSFINIHENDNGMVCISYQWVEELYLGQ